ncbi:MAG: right-handed parallel beta-helix repeat-containing protein [Acidobacteriota bacterium]
MRPMLPRLNFGLAPILLAPILLAPILLAMALPAPAAHAATYYVSSISGDDTADGLTPNTAFASVSRVNALDLEPGDAVRFFCGDTWRVDPLHVIDSGTAAQPIVISSHPAGCTDQPVLSGARGIAGWTVAGPNLYRADLDAGANAGRFPLGIGHLFRGDERLPLGRWPNIEGHPDGGYAEVDTSPSTTQITDGELPAGDWTGAVLRLKGIRWYLLNREVTSDSGSTLGVNAPLSCYQESCDCFSGDCAEWGYYLTAHPATLDREGEWYFDAATNEVLLYSTGPAPADGEIEAAVVQASDGRFHGAVTLGRQLEEHVAWVTVENLRIERWFANGITFPENLRADENHDLTIRGNTIAGVDDVGLRLTTWVWQPGAGNGPVGWRGGRNLRIEGNTLIGANNRGLLAYSVASEFLDNTLRDIALIPQLGHAGMGCGFDTAGECTENGDGLAIIWASVAPDHTARDNLMRGNRLSHIGMNGIDVYGRDHVIEHNVVEAACQSKGDCGGIRIYGQGDLATTPTHDVTVRGNVVRDTLGNTDGVHPYFDDRFGFGLYFDNWVRDITAEDNTVTGSSWVGLIYRLASGTATGNVLYDNVDSDYGTELSVIGGSDVTLAGNILFPIGFLRESFRVSDLSVLAASDGNRFFSPYDPTSLWDETLAGNPNLDDRLTLAEWQTHSGWDAGSSSQWYTLGATEPRRSGLFVNDSAAPRTVPLVGTWLDLDQQPVASPLTLAPYSSRILIRNGSGLIFADGFESGDTSAW